MRGGRCEVRGARITLCLTHTLSSGDEISLSLILSFRRCRCCEGEDL